MTHEPRFAHASEAELARILDYYGVRWQYEPRTFPIQWNLDGTVVESFAPDFFLPDLDLYVELTTLKQSLVRRKNRKLRRLRELYPDVRVKLFYGKDFKALMLKYGRLDIAASLSGLEGQALAAQRTHDRGSVAAPLAASARAPLTVPLATHASDRDSRRGAVEPAPVTRVAAVSGGTTPRSRPSRGQRRRRARRQFSTSGPELT